ncbi:MAG: hypothetical protein ABFR90_09840 [Planctomycetota bacterium]
MMDSNHREYRRQWAQLLVLTAAHFVLDMFPGLMHTLLPAMQESFHLSKAAGAVVLTFFLVSANGIQVVIGHLRSEKDRPLFLYAGILLTCAVLLFTIVPNGPMAVVWLSIIATVCAAGVGMTHPEGLRAIHRLDRISSTVSSMVFMSGGIIGFAFGAWASTHLFSWWGFFGLLPFCVMSVTALLLMAAFRIRLAVERDEIHRQSGHPQREPVSFWMVMAMATLVASSVTILGWIIPQRFDELALPLSDGGIGVSIFSLSGGIGGIVMIRLAMRYGELKTIRWMLAAGIPFVIAYLCLMEHRWSAALFFFGGFFCFGSYPIMVSIARHCKGPSLGRRMGLIVGGIWLAACLLPMILGPLVDAYGTIVVVICAPIGFVLSLILSIASRKRD